MRPEHDQSVSGNGFFETWKLAMFQPRTFFSKPIGKRSRVSPITFVVLLSFFTAGPGTAVSLVLTGSELNVGTIVNAMFLAPVVTVVGIYISALFVHGLLRLVGVGGVAPRSVDGPPEKEIPPPNPDDPYAPPKTLGAVGKRKLGPFRETVQAIAYAHASIVFGVFGPPGQIVATIWSLVVCVIALSCVHQTSLLRSIGVIIAPVVSPVLFALVLRVGIIEAFKIPSGSMIPTLMMGDHVFISKLAYGPLLPNSDQRLFSRLPPARADVMVFKFPENKNQDFIKRAIALPGDTLEAINGRPILNGWLVPNCYVGKFGRDDSDMYVEFLEDKSYLTLYSPYGTETKGPDKPACQSADDCGRGQTCRVGICGHHQGPFKVKDNEVWVMGDNRHNSHDSRSWRGGQGAGVPFENIKGRVTYVWMSFAPAGGVASDRLFIDVMGTPTLPPNAGPTLGAALEKCLRERPAREQTTPPKGSP